MDVNVNMNVKIVIAAGICIIFLLLCLLIGIIYFYKRKEKKLLNRIRRMLEEAIDGAFIDIKLEESRISEIESSMRRFLCDCRTSSCNLKNQQQKIQELISDISHQTITPLANIKIYLELLAEKISEYEAAEEDDMEEIEAIYEQADKLDFLIRSLVKMSRLETDIITVNPQRECIQKVLDAVEKQYRQNAEYKKIQFIVEPSQEEAVFDEKWTAEVIANIVDNAIKYTEECGKVTVRVQAYSLFLRVDIEDNGIGIAESEQGKIFTRFYRSPSVSRQPGVGIGLFLAREVLKAQQGYIKVTSKKGEGSKFSVFLPST
jgi:signal transduction histidine kinase